MVSPESSHAASDTSEGGGVDVDHAQGRDDHGRDEGRRGLRVGVQDPGVILGPRASLGNQDVRAWRGQARLLAGHVPVITVSHWGEQVSCSFVWVDQ
jgi:hypothetical protein